MITIGIDPHKASLIAVAVDASGTPLGRRRLLVHAGTLMQLTAWAAGWPVRRFTVEGAFGLGRPIAQLLAAAGEQVLDVPATLAAQARLLNTGGGRKSDGADAAAAFVERPVGTLEPTAADPGLLPGFNKSGPLYINGCGRCCFCLSVSRPD